MRKAWYRASSYLNNDGVSEPSVNLNICEQSVIIIIVITIIIITIIILLPQMFAMFEEVVETTDKQYPNKRRSR